MEMRCSRFRWSFWCAVVGGAVMAFGPASGRPTVAWERDYAAGSYADAEETPGHFDNGPVPGDALAAEGGSAGEASAADQPAQPRGEFDEPARYAEQYYAKYGYRYANSETPSDASNGSSNDSSNEAADSESGDAWRHHGYEAATSEGYYGQAVTTGDENESSASPSDAAASMSDEADQAAEAADETDNTSNETGSSDEAETASDEDNRESCEHRCMSDEAGSASDETSSTSDEAGHTSDDAAPATDGATSASDEGEESEHPNKDRFWGEPGEVLNWSHEDEAASGSESDAATDSPADASSRHDAEQEAEAELESGLDLFAADPAELLFNADQELLRTLAAQAEERAETRQRTLSRHLAAMGAIDFASNLEEATGVEVIELTDNLPGLAAFLGVYRLVERGELAMDEGVDLLERSLRSSSPSWLDGVAAMTAGALEQQQPEASPALVENPSEQNSTTMNGPTVADALATLARDSFERFAGAIRTASGQAVGMDWARLYREATEGQAANQNGVDRF